VDVSVHEKNLDGTLKELHRASGGPWGGTCVDDAYIAWLTKLFGEKAMEKLKREAMGEYIDLLREFENKKRTITTKMDGQVTLRVSVALKEYQEECEEETITAKIARLDLNKDVKIQRDKLRVSADIARSWFQEPIDSTIRHISGILAEPEMADVKTILLVGGFGECQLMHEAVIKSVGRRAVVIPEEAGLAVLKGAVRFGHKPRTVSSRCVKFTYGYAVNTYFDESKHPLEKMCIGPHGDMFVENVFGKIVEIGTSVEVGKNINTPILLMNKKGYTMTQIYASTERDPQYTTDPSCRHVGKLKLGKAPGETEKENEIEQYFAFGDTELKVTVKILKTGQVLSKIMDCL